MAEKLHREATSLSLFRVNKSGEGVTYHGAESNWTTLETFIRRCEAVGHISEASDGYGVLDVWNHDGDVIQDYTIPTAHAFQHIKRQLGVTREFYGKAKATDWVTL